MKLVIIEPLGVEKDKLLSIARNALKDSVEIIYYDTKTTIMTHVYGEAHESKSPKFHILYNAA